jgi:Arc/MetJ family transcription regulator
MRTNILIDDELIAQALHASGLPTKRAAVEAGLRLLIQVHEQGGLRRLRGMVQWQGDLEAQRAGRFADQAGDYNLPDKPA